MMNTTLVYFLRQERKASLTYSFGQTVLDSSTTYLKKKAKVKLESKDPDEFQIIEGYEGECEKCEQTKPQKACSICAE